MLREPLRDVPADRVDHTSTRFRDVCDSAGDNPRGMPVTAETRDCEGSGEGDGLTVIAVVENAHELSAVVQFVPRGIRLLGQGELEICILNSHPTTLIDPDAEGRILTREVILSHNRRMTTNAHPLSAQEANRSAGMMMAGSVGMCCRMCS